MSYVSRVWSATWSVHECHVISACYVTWQVCDQPREQCMFSHVFSAWTDTWTVYDQPRDQCMISKWSVHDHHVISVWSATWTVHAQSRDLGLLSCDPLEFSRQEKWSGLPFPTPVDLPNPGMATESLMSPSLAGEFFITVPLETHQKRLWCWEGLRAGGEGDDRSWDGWMALLTWWTWVWVNSRSWWWSGRPGVLRFMESQRVGHDWMMELNWTERSPL